MADLRINIGADDKASEKVGKVGSALHGLAGATAAVAAAGAAMAAAFVTHGVKALAAEEEATRKLIFATGALGEGFARQAEAMEHTLGVSSESVKQMQAMLFRYGEAPGQINATTKALLDYAAASGTDALAATEEMVRAVDSGKQAFKEAGLAYDKTGTKSEQLAGLTEALAGKFGGGAEDKANTLAGRTELARVALDDLAKSFGGMVVQIEQKYSVLKTAGEMLNWIRISAGGSEKTDAETALSERQDRIIALSDRLAAMKRGQAEAARNAIDGKSSLYADEIKDGLEELRKLKLDPAMTAVNPNDGLTTKGATERAEARKKASADRKAQEQKDLEDSRRMAAEVANALADGEDAEAKLRDKADAEELQREEEMDRKLLEAAERRGRALMEQEERSLRQRQEQAEQLGLAIGGAVAGGISNAIGQLDAGGEVDVGGLLIDILAGSAQAALTIFGGPVGALGAMAVGVGAQGLKAATRRRHEGGWVEAPRMHDGAWVGADEQPAILQSGERVLSRSEVRGMGGPTGVDSAARGAGGGARITVNTLDGSTAREYFERAGGRALLNAVRTGRGTPVSLFGGA